MIAIVFIVLALMIVGGWLIGYGMGHAPYGRQDDSGFHFESK